MFAKDVVVPGRMRRRIPNPRVLLLDCPLEYKKAESQTNVEITKEEDWCAQSGAVRGSPGPPRGVPVWRVRRVSSAVAPGNVA